MQQKIIFIDLDGTLTPGSTWLAVNTMLGISPEEDTALFERYLKNDLEYTAWTKELVRLHAEHDAVRQSDFIHLAENVELRSDAQVCITSLKEKGYRTVLISGSIDVVVETIATKLGCDSWLACTKAVFDDQGQFTDFVSMGDESPAKVVLAKQYCEEHQYDLSSAIVVGDGGNEKDLFEISKGILLGSNEKLAPLSWKQVETLSQIIELV